MTGPRIEWHAAARPLDSAQESGDQYLVKHFEGGALVAVVDGLGHGPDAAEAARTAIGLLEEHAHESPAKLVRRCHDGLRSTRGAVLSLASFDCGLMTWIGVGNVDGILLRADGGGRAERLLVRSGLLGHQLPLLEPSRVSVGPGDTLILATDGVHSAFDQALERRAPREPSADAILAAYAKASDDALVVVARYVGAAA
jgi:serine/threonine protein phosphatase PrpC